MIIFLLHSFYSNWSALLYFGDFLGSRLNLVWIWKVLHSYLTRHTHLRSILVTLQSRSLRSSSAEVDKTRGKETKKEMWDDRLAYRVAICSLQESNSWLLQSPNFWIDWNFVNWPIVEISLNFDWPVIAGFRLLLSYMLLVRTCKNTNFVVYGCHPVTVAQDEASIFEIFLLLPLVFPLVETERRINDFCWWLCLFLHNADSQFERKAKDGR